VRNVLVLCKGGWACSKAKSTFWLLVMPLSFGTPLQLLIEKNTFKTKQGELTAQ
jgi:hypothetical protein